MLAELWAQRKEPQTLLFGGEDPWWARASWSTYIDSPLLHPCLAMLPVDWIHPLVHMTLPVARPNSAHSAPQWPCELHARAGVEAGPSYLYGCVCSDGGTQGAKPLLARVWLVAGVWGWVTPLIFWILKIQIWAWLGCRSRNCDTGMLQWRRPPLSPSSAASTPASYLRRTSDSVPRGGESSTWSVNQLRTLFKRESRHGK